MKNLKNLLCMLCLAAGVTVVFAGCMAQDPAETTIEKFVLSSGIDLDNDGFADVGLPGGDVQIAINKACEEAPSEGTSELCVETLGSRLHGTGDCDFVIADDPLGCKVGPIDCDDAQFSVCAPCINPDALEVIDGVDNNCDGVLLPGECDDDADCPAGQECLDNICVQSDVCAGVLCGDGNDCTDDSCNPATGNCINAPDDTNVCSDNNLCTVDNKCKGGACVGTDVDCDDANVCTNDACVPDEGCVHVNNTVVCNDGNACTTADACAGGFCTGGFAPDCDDANACTVDSCDPALGCVHTPMACNDGLLCTDDSCNPLTGCSNAPVNCNDTNICTTDSCNPIAGDCINNPIPGCAATCNPANDAGGEKFGDCAPFTPANFNDAIYGWGCLPSNNPLIGTCVQYEDQDGDEWADTPESICSDGVDGDLDGLVDCMDPNCFGLQCPQCVKNANCDDANPNTVDTCVLGLCEYCTMQCAGKECGGNGCGGSCGNCNEAEVCELGLCVAVPVAPQPEGSGDCGDGIDNDLDGLFDCAEAACNGAPCAAGKTCQTGACLVTPPVQPVTFVTIEVTAPSSAEIWLFASKVVKSALSPATFTLSQEQACTNPEVEIGARTDSGTWPWWGCPLNDPAPSKTTLVVKVNGVVAAPTFKKSASACSNQGEGNLSLSKAQLKCP